MIVFEEVAKVYQTRQRSVRALDGVSLEIATGAYVAIRGPSGCGKSTLLSLTGGLALPTSGRVTVSDTEVSALSSAQRAKFRATNVGFVFQMFHLLPYLNVLDNILVAAEDASDTNVRQRAEQMLNQFGLKQRQDHRPSQLSAGERQRVAMARALLNKPKLLLADEPTGNLDPVNAAAVLDVLDQFHNDGGTIVLVTHEEAAASRADYTIILTAGKLAQSADVGCAEPA
jgi:ABC-type lipoprotein export system ATPase subunit